MNKFEKRSMKSYNEIANNYDDSPEGQYTLSFKKLLLEQMIVPENSAVLDIACGNGRFLEMLSQRYTIKGYGVDISRTMIENATHLNPNMFFSTAPCDKLPFENDMFDVVTVCAAFHHFPNPTSFATETMRVVKKGGRLYIAEIYYPAVLRAILNPFVPLSKAGDVKFYAPKEIEKILSQAGFSNISVNITGNIQVISAIT